MATAQKYAIHWFRRDLRVAGNQTLKKAFQDFDGRVLGLFCFDKSFLSRPDFSINRFQFFLNRLKCLREELRLQGSDLLVLDQGPMQAFQLLFEKLHVNNLANPHRISWSRDYEPFALMRDQEMSEFFTEKAIEVETFRDHLLLEPHEVTKADGTGYQVFTPFAKTWNRQFKTELVQKRIKALVPSEKYLTDLSKGKASQVFSLSWDKLGLSEFLKPDVLKAYIAENKKRVSVEIPDASSSAAYASVLKFKNHLNSYGKVRDFPAKDGTSGLSIYLKNGTLTVPMLIHFFKLKPFAKARSGLDIYLNELIWREFYYHILFRHPQVEKESFAKRYKKLKWPNNQKLFEAWKQGLTGYPIVDAGMRQLKQTGLMHNRVRMIVASFLVKDLLIDWRWGEQYFMETLLDGDLAPNNGGWQWAASTGCDPQPYFRIFNPWLQSKKFDAEGGYIKKYIPELSDLEVKALHAPIIGHKKYPEPIVDHGAQKVKALNFYKSAL